MGRSAGKRAALALAAVVVVAGLSGCEDGDGGTKPGASSASPAAQSREEATKAVRAAYGRTAEARSAKVEMRLVVSGTQGAGSSTFTGVQGWSPSVADLKVTDSSYLADIPGAPVETRAIASGGTTYMDVGATQAARTGGKRWMRIDPEQAAGEDELLTQLTAGLSTVNQDPAKELGLLAEAPSVRHIGPVTDHDVKAQAYEGELAGGKRVEVWIGADGYPVRMIVETTTDRTLTKLTTDYTGYGTSAAVQAPPAEDTFDLMELLKKIVAGGGQG
ncbi:hypothetical protein PV371_09995 [Streptomyces sp. TX20-6-3]|uniref:hypothetical protein n=1 Tax=Streptomyces sp. TX20-6-3 TaxID=3028705 RepID=UPI0029A51DAB|nr:hypothetical protein [Streptomyces sp. TX20-6-3]MDX2559981.1 hypothetical protein [Streptomyces sp. TX20-6-3]